MENIITIIIAIVIMAIGAYRKEQKRKAEAFKSMEKEDSNPWIINPNEVEFVQRPLKEEALRRETLINKANINEQKFRDKKTVKINVKQNDESKIENTKPDILYDFSLRKAVIYSEILKPKFDEI